MSLSAVPADQSAKPALELISLATMSPEAARRNLRARLIANPEYFSRISSNSFKAVLRIQQDTSYESIGSATYNSHLEQVQASIHIHKSLGFSDINGASKEFVRFYLSYDGCSSWLDQGLCSFEVCNLPGPKPLQIAVAVGISPTLTLCFLDRLPVVRVVLSWNAAPPAEKPDWIPVWGDVLNAQLRLGEANASRFKNAGRDS